MPLSVTTSRGVGGKSNPTTPPLNAVVGVMVWGVVGGTDSRAMSLPPSPTMVKSTPFRTSETGNCVLSRCRITTSPRDREWGTPDGGVKSTPISNMVSCCTGYGTSPGTSMLITKLSIALCSQSRERYGPDSARRPRIVTG